MPIYNFKRSLIAGTLGESRFAMLYPQMQATDGRTCDFISGTSGLRYEVKTESRTTLQTPNVAIELSSSFKRPGALHNAFKHSDVIVFLFGDGKSFSYSIYKLYYWVRQYKHLYRQVKVNNGTYSSTVLLVPRIAIRSLGVPVV